MAALRIDADLLLPGRGEPLRPGTVLVDGAAIAYAGPPADLAADQVVVVPTVMPGMWDAHIHFWGMERPNVEGLATTPPQLGVLRASRDLRRVLDAGFTSVREVGGFGTYLATAVEEGTISGPSVYASGSVLSQTGGHGDVHALPIRQVDDLCERNFGAPSIADGPDDCRRIVRRQLRLGAKVIKVCASGGVMSQVDHPIHQQFSVEELRAMVEEAARAERVVAAHCHGKPGIMAAIEAGVATIEHGTYLDEEAATAMVERGMILVPTRLIVAHLLAEGKATGMPAYAVAKIEAIAGRHAEALATAVAAGVRIAAGTDMFVRALYGRNGEELSHLVAAGMTPLQAIEAATATGPLTLGPQAPRSGMLAAGMEADLIAVNGDPLTDIAVLADPTRITHVWQRGVQVR